MTTINATQCDALGCPAKTVEDHGSEYVAKGWTHAVITTRVGVTTVDFCELHSKPLYEAVASAKGPR